MRKKKRIGFINALTPILGLMFCLVYGLIIHPRFVVGDPGSQVSLEVIFMFAAMIGVANLFYLGFSWKEIEESMAKKLSQLTPAMIILLSIGVLIGSWVLSGTTPMLVIWGIKMINPSFIYIVAFLVPSIFSLLTGTSWGSVGTIGVVIMGIAVAVDANLAIVAGAIVGGAYFGDKMSPLSDTTNIAALAAGVDLYDHIRSMIFTTAPGYLIALILYGVIGLTNIPPASPETQAVVDETVKSLNNLFNYNLLLLLPIVIVIYGSATQKPTVPTLLGSSFIAILLSMLFQPFSIQDILSMLNSGFSHKVAFPGVSHIPENVIGILNRGGLYSMVGNVIISIMVFLYISTLDSINAFPVVMHRVFKCIKTRPAAILSALFATAFTNASTSNQFATSFIVAEAFKPKFKELKISKRVLSRSLEDAGTMIENIIPWTTTGVFMSQTLGIATTSYLPYQFLTFTTLVFAILAAITGKGCYYHLSDKEYKDSE